MFNPLINTIEHKKQFEKIQEDSKFNIKKKKKSQKTPSVTVSFTPKHAQFINDLAVDLTIKYRKILNLSDVVRLIIEYAENFKDELPLFYEITRKK